MLRVHPLLSTPEPERDGALCVALGMVRSVDGAGRVVVDAGAGRITLLSAAGGDLLTPGFEVGDLDEFALRTRASGTAAEVVSEPDGGTSVLVSAPALSFRAGLGERQLPPGPDPALTVVTLWYTPDPVQAGKVLRDIGARPRDHASDHGLQDFQAKNGGLVALREGGRQRFELGFEYTGDLAALRDRVGESGFPAQLSDTGHSLGVELAMGRSLVVIGRGSGAAD